MDQGRQWTRPVHLRHSRRHHRRPLMIPCHPLSHAAVTCFHRRCHAMTSFRRRCHHVGLSTSTAFHPVHLYGAPVDTRLCPATHTHRTAVYRSCLPRPIDSHTYDRAVASIARSFVWSSVCTYCNLLCQDDVCSKCAELLLHFHAVDIASIFGLGSWLADLKLVTLTISSLVGSVEPWSPTIGLNAKLSVCLMHTRLG